MDLLCASAIQSGQASENSPAEVISIVANARLCQARSRSLSLSQTTAVAASTARHGSTVAR